MNDYPPLPRWKTILGCYNGWTSWQGRKFDHEKPLSHLWWVIWYRCYKISQWPTDFRMWLAGWLCRIAAWLRGEKWFAGDYFSAPGNRASVLQQEIWTKLVVHTDLHDQDDHDALDQVGRNLTELGQLAQSKWAHIEPKKPTGPC